MRIYDELKKKILALTKFILELFCTELQIEDTVSQGAGGQVLDLRDMYLDKAYFNEENREYIKDCVVEYARTKFAANKIHRAMRKVMARRKITGKFKQIDFNMLKVATGKSILQEYLNNIGRSLSNLKANLE